LSCRSRRHASTIVRMFDTCKRNVQIFYRPACLPAFRLRGTVGSPRFSRRWPGTSANAGRARASARRSCTAS
jgi:hypothetical protein